MAYQYLVIVFLSFVAVYGAEWPVPYERLPSRPAYNSYCQAGAIPFCPAGKTEDAMIYAPNDTDVIEIFALKKPVWYFRFGSLLANFKIMHDGLGFRDKQTGRNWTMEWYELDQLFNCTFTHVLANDTFIWCDQGALCVYDGIDDAQWYNTSSLSLLKKIGEISGKAYNTWATWAISDNNTGVFYESWTVYSDNSTNATMYFDSYDCASFVVRGLNELDKLGAVFLPDVHLNYTRLSLFTYEPELLGTYDQIVQNETLHDDFIEFYRDFDSKKPKTEDWLVSLMEIYETFYLTRRFYLYYNSVYWYLKFKPTPIAFSFNEIPIVAGF